MKPTIPTGREAVVALPFIFAVDELPLMVPFVVEADDVFVWLSTDVRSPDVDDPGVDDLPRSILESLSQVIIVAEGKCRQRQG